MTKTNTNKPNCCAVCAGYVVCQNPMCDCHWKKAIITHTTSKSEEWARLFHDTYEKLAPKYGYETRKETKEFDPESPNGKLMIVVCNLICHQAYQQALEDLRKEMPKKRLPELEQVYPNGINPDVKQHDDRIGFNSCLYELTQLLDKLQSK